MLIGSRVRKADEFLLSKVLGQDAMHSYLRFSMKIKVGIVTFPLSEAGGTPLLNLVKLFSRIADGIFLISGGAALKGLEPFKNVHIKEVFHKQSLNIIARIINYAHTELMILRNVILIHRKVDLFVFFIGGETMLIPILTSKILGNKVLLMPGGIVAKGYSIRNDPLSRLISALIRFNLTLADRIIVYSQFLIREGKWERYQHKMLVAHEHFVDFALFKMKKRIGKRREMIGYIGSLSKVKGILNLVKAMTCVLKEKNVHFVICGQGDLAYNVENLVKAEGVKKYVKLVGWVPHQDLPRHLNEMKLLVLPSFTEGLPNVILEAMACGTPVLTTSVGAIPDIIKDGETGFLLKSNDPRHIAERIVELLNKPELLEKVSINAYRYVRENFSYKKTIEAWQEIFNELGLL